MADSSIQWTDKTWNPVTGCTRASRGCDHCYAVKMTSRLELMGKEKYRGLVNPGKAHFNGVVKCHEDALGIPLKWKKGCRIFVNSMSDLFHKDVPFEFVDRVFAVMALCPQHTFQILTKRPERMAEYFEKRKDLGTGFPPEVTEGMQNVNTEAFEKFLNDADSPYEWPLPNVWLGTSVEDQAAADERIPHLLKCPAAVRFLSCEPLLGLVDLSNKWFWASCSQCDGAGVVGDDDPQNEEDCSRCGGYGLSDDALDEIHWVIAGGESGPEARPMHPDWARSLRDQCMYAKVPFFFKQWGAFAHGSGGRPAESVVVLTNGQWGPNTHEAAVELDRKVDGRFSHFAPTIMRRVGKGAAGRELDGRTWDEFPLNEDAWMMRAAQEEAGADVSAGGLK